MEMKFAISNLSQVIRQRNLFLVGMIFMLIANVVLSIKILFSDQKIIMVPGLRQEVMVSKNRISHSYLEEMTLVFLSNLLDLSPKDIAYKKALVMKYTSASNEKVMKEVAEYFAIAEEKYKKFDLTTYFTVKNMELDTEELKVLVHGILTSSYGKRGFESKAEDYFLEFEFSGGVLRLKSFMRIKKEEKEGI